MPDPLDQPIGQNTTTLDYLRARHEWLGQAIDEYEHIIAALRTRLAEAESLLADAGSLLKLAGHRGVRFSEHDSNRLAVIWSELSDMGTRCLVFKPTGPNEHLHAAEQAAGRKEKQ